MSRTRLPTTCLDPSCGESTHGQWCDRHAADHRQPDPRPSPSLRGYGRAHQALRAQLLASLEANPGRPCPRCGEPMTAADPLDLDHTDDRTGYRGLAHAACNRGHR